MTEARIRPDAGDTPPNNRIDEWLRLREAPRLSVRAINNSGLSVTEVRYDRPDYGVTDPVIHQDAFVVGLQLKPYPFHELWYDGKVIPVRGVQPGDALFCDLRAVDGVRTAVPFHSLQFFLSRSFLNELADDVEAPRIDGIRIQPGVPVRDPVFAQLGRMVQPALQNPRAADELYTSHCMLAIGTYVCATYGGLRPPKRHVGGLNAWQERVAKEMIEAHVGGSIALQRLAGICGLSASHFSHAFKKSIGLAPHQWLLQRRVERAKRLLRHSAETLSDIALNCGFADQSHFTRVFRRVVGASPGTWKRSVR